MAKENISLSVVLHDDSDYKDWLVELKERFYSHRLKASCATNGYLLDFYWKLGRDIEAKQYTNNYGSGFYKNLSQDLKKEMPGVKGFSPTNLKYMSYFYKLYAPLAANRQQLADDFTECLIGSDIQPVAEQIKNRQQAADDFKLLFMIPWDHHCRIISKCKGDMDKALFFVRKTWENNWGRDALLNWLDTDLYERDGKAITNFQSTLPAVQSDLKAYLEELLDNPVDIIRKHQHLNPFLLKEIRKVCASVHFIPPRLYGPFATCNHYTIPTNRLPQRRDSPLFPPPDNMFQMKFFLKLLDEETY